MTAGPDSSFVTQRYDTGAQVYDEEWSAVILPGAVALVDTLELSASARVLDVGTGTGAVVPVLRDAAPDGLVVGIDPSGGMLARARDRGGAAFVRGDAEHLPVRTETFDAAVFPYVLFHVPDPAAALREAARVVVGGGRIGTVTWETERVARAAVEFGEALNEAGAPMPPVVRRDEGMNSPDAVRSLFAEAGLDDCGVTTVALGHTFSVDALWRLATRSGLAKWRLDQLADDVRTSLLGALEERLGTLGPEALRFEGTVLVAVATRST